MERWKKEKRKGSVCVCVSVLSRGWMERGGKSGQSAGQVRDITYCPPKSCMPSRAKTTMKRKRRKSKLMMDFIELRRETTRFLNEFQYLRRSSKHRQRNNFCFFFSIKCYSTDKRAVKEQTDSDNQCLKKDRKNQNRGGKRGTNGNI